MPTVHWNFELYKIGYFCDFLVWTLEIYTENKTKIQEKPRESANDIDLVNTHTCYWLVD